MLSIVGINVCIVTHSEPNSSLSNLFRQARFGYTPMSFVVVDCQSTSVILIGFLPPSLGLEPGPVVVVVYFRVSI
jgi:hypothetical protein